MGTETALKPLAVVTGASSGIGLELAKQFATHGFDLLIAAEDAAITIAARELEGMGGGRGVHVEPVQVDLATYEGVEQLCAAIASAGRPVEAIAINAGVGVGGDFVRETSLEAELNLLSLNVISTVHLAKRVLPSMVARGRREQWISLRRERRGRRCDDRNRRRTGGFRGWVGGKRPGGAGLGTYVQGELLGQSDGDHRQQAQGLHTSQPGLLCDELFRHPRDQRR